MVCSMGSNDKVKYLQSLKSGGVVSGKSGIHIKKENRGKFTASAKRAGEGVQEHAHKVMNNPNATTLQKRRANFAIQAAKWSHKKKKHQYGGLVYNPAESQYTTQLTPAEEQAFREWYNTYAMTHGNNRNPDKPEHYYDYRGYWKNGPEVQSLIFNEHLPDTWKVPGHPTMSDESIYYTNSSGPTIDSLADFTGGFETFSAVPYELKTEDGRIQTLAGYGSANPEIIQLAREGKLTKEIARKEMLRRLQYDYDEWTRQLPEFKNLPEDVKLALVDTSYNGKGVTGTIKNSPKLISLIKSGITDGKTLSAEMDHSKTAGGWLGVRSAARRAMAQGKYDWNWGTVDKYGRQVDYSQYKGPDDYKSSPYFGKYQSGGNLLYTPFIPTSITQKSSKKNGKISLRDFLSSSTETPFPVEPVKVENLTYPELTFNTGTTKQRGATQFKREGIDVGNMRELLDKFEEAGISVRVTSGTENRTTKQGKKSRHAVGDAIDITPIAGQSYADLRSQIMNSPELLEYMRDNGIGIIDETDPVTKAVTGATGDHWHISRRWKDGNSVGEKMAIRGFNKLFG